MSGEEAVGSIFRSGNKNFHGPPIGGNLHMIVQYHRRRNFGSLAVYYYDILDLQTGMRYKDWAVNGAFGESTNRWEFVA